MRRMTPAGFDDKAEIQEFELIAQKPTLTIACRIQARIDAVRVDWNPTIL